MASIRQHVVLKAPVEVVWQMVGDPAAITEWAPSIASCEMQGTTRILTLDRGGTVEEDIVTLDRSLHRIQYCVRKGLPVESHLATVDVIELSAGSCIVIYGTDVTPNSVSKHIATAIEGSIRYLGAKYGEA